MRFWIAFLVMAPLLSAALIQFVVPKSEKIVSKVASLTKLMIVFGTLICIILWAYQGFIPIEAGFGDLRFGDYHFPLLFYLDRVSFTFLTVIGLISAVIIRYCRYYLHRERGYPRFFTTIFLFISGMNLIVTAGTLDLLFAGWEIVGISSFLLIAFYRERTLPVRNAFRAYVVYRICDLGLLLGIWMAHLIFSSSHFSVLSHLTHSQALAAGYLPLLGFSLLLLIAASGKSAQFPFCYWLPRAMEGPTPSSAIFYGALSIHAGVFLLIRTFSVWHTLITARILIAVVGILSALISTLSGRTQSNIKGELAYASISQVGIMLVELALGLPELALLHATANAFLKCYQLLVSPSVVAQILRIQGTASTGIQVSDWSLERRLPSRWRSSLYVLALNEGYLEQVLFLIFRPIRLLARMVFRFVPGVRWWGATGTLVLVVMLNGIIAPHFREVGLGVTVLLMILFSLSASYDRESPIRVWNTVSMSQLLAGLLPIFMGSELKDLWPYFAGILPGWLLGKVCLFRLCPDTKKPLTLWQFQGKVAQAPFASQWFFVSVLALVTFPITPTFFGEDLLLHYCRGVFVWMAGAIAFTFVINGLTLIQLFSRICLGPGDPLTTDKFSSALSAIGLSPDPKH